ncbi:MAG: hypothetical protein WDN72_07775 [Alphaproteobacteria bacterium]
MFCGVIGLVFLLALIDGWVRLSAVHQEIRRGVATLAGVPDRTAFFAQFESLADQFARQPLFAAAWLEFTKTVILDPARALVLATRRPEEFFHDGALLTPRVNLRLFNAVPGYLISLGLFFTFVGLVAAISIAANGLAAGDVNATQRALTALLQVASVKFISSVAGISLSIILSFVQKVQLGKASRGIHEFGLLLEQRTQLITTEQLLHRWLLAQEQTTRGLQHLAEDIATEVTMNLGGKS